MHTHSIVNRCRHRQRLILGVAGLLILHSMLCAVVPAAAPGTTFDERRKQLLASYLPRELRQGPNPGTWVDSERWCVAHACLEAGVRLDEANRYLAEVQFASLWQGLVADTDVQVADLLWTYLRFRDSPRLTTPARDRLLALFREWRVPNTDRNRDADQAYIWPAEYTENHSLNILAAAYLIDFVLARERDTHRQLLLEFLADRARWGWSEFHSPRYALVTVKALAMLTAAAPDQPVVDAARMHLDLLALEFANTGLHCWRGLPFARGAGAENDNRRDAFFELACYWFGAPAGIVKEYQASPMLLHALTSDYRPPDAAARLLQDPALRGHYTMTETLTTGPGKLRVPLVIRVSPQATMASAQGAGSYYDGAYWSISFASGPDRTIVGHYGKGRNLLQCDNVLATFGDVAWNGPLQRTAAGAITIGGDGQVLVGQIDLPDACHVLMLADSPTDTNTFRHALEQLEATFSEGEVRWRMPDGRKIRMLNRRDGDRWRMAGAWADGQPIRLDRNLLLDSPFLRSVRDSGRIEALTGRDRIVYDFSDRQKPVQHIERQRALTPLWPEWTNGPAGIRLAHIPAGEFPMGSPLTEGRANERPMRWVYLDGFYISETEITTGQYRQFLKANPKVVSPPDWYWKEWGKTDAYPMTWVSWHEAQAFCQWLSTISKHTFRLPTEAEWEKAARGYAYRVYPWGDEYDGTQSGTPNGEYAPAGQHPLDVSPFGVRGMAGNAWEWCADYFDPTACQSQPARNPTGPGKGDSRALRGCGWNFDPDTFRCAYRSRLEPGGRSVHIGFRVVREP